MVEGHFILFWTRVRGFSIVDDVAQRLGLRVEDAGQGSGVGEKKVRAGRTRIRHSP